MLGFDKLPLWGILLISAGSAVVCALVVWFFVCPRMKKKIDRKYHIPLQSSGEGHVLANQLLFPMGAPISCGAVISRILIFAQRLTCSESLGHSSHWALPAPNPGTPNPPRSNCCAAEQCLGLTDLSGDLSWSCGQYQTACPVLIEERTQETMCLL